MENNTGEGRNHKAGKKPDWKQSWYRNPYNNILKISVVNKFNNIIHDLYICNLHVTSRSPELCLTFPESAGYPSPCRYTKNNTNQKWDATKELEWSHKTKFCLSFHCWVTDKSSHL